MKRVMIMGQPGAGKSTLARGMGRITGLPVVHVDLIHWMPGWQERPMDEKLSLAHAAEAEDEWIFEGGLSRTWDNRLARCDTLIWLDFPIGLRVWRVFKRTLKDYGRSRADLPANCPERFDPEFWRWIWNTRKRNRVKAGQFFERARADKDCHHLRNPRQVSSYLAELESRFA